MLNSKVENRGERKRLELKIRPECTVCGVEVGAFWWKCVPISSASSAHGVSYGRANQPEILVMYLATLYHLGSTSCDQGRPTPRSITRRI